MSSQKQGGRVSRRSLLKGGLAIGAAGAAIGTGLSSSAGASIERAMTLDANSNPDLGDIRHVVFLMQENRSFDHYFGTMSGVTGYSDPTVLVHDIFGTDFSVFKQFGYRPGFGVDDGGYMEPFHLQQIFPTKQGECTNDITHEWGPQHRSWNNGKMDSWVATHVAVDGKNFAPTMGYFNRADLPFYYALADNFTILDHYFCSVLGPTDPNRTLALSGTIDPDGELGGPVLKTQVQGRATQYGKFKWETMPERLLDAGISWKVYNDPTGLALFSPLPYFKSFVSPGTTRGDELIAKGITPNFPADLLADVQANTLPQVSWIHGPVTQCEHPATAPAWGENLVQGVLDILTSNPEVWAHTLFILHYDENGGFFDHVPPPTPPPGTEGEYLTMTPLPPAASGVAGPVGLGFRVPCFIISPFTRGGYVASDIFDHTSTLKLLETLFGAEAPNISAWRRETVGDMTSALSLGQPADVGVPKLPDASLLVPLVDEQVVANALLGFFHEGYTYPPPDANNMPVQEAMPGRNGPPQ